jgi:hypothetical protein
MLVTHQPSIAFCMVSQSPNRSSECYAIFLVTRLTSQQHLRYMDCKIVFHIRIQDSGLRRPVRPPQTSDQ